MTPTFILRTWFLGLLSLTIIASAYYAGYQWHESSWRWDDVHQRSYFSPQWGANRETFLFTAGLFLAVMAFGGGLITKGILYLIIKAKANHERDPRHAPEPTDTRRLTRPHGVELEVKFYGPEGGIPLVLTHGWGLNSDEWNYLKQTLAREYRLIVWDLPGLGKSTRPQNRDFSLETLAGHLDAVLEFAGAQPAILVGHSIGGMITLTYCRQFPSALNKRVAGLVLTHTTPANPVRTTSGAAFYTAIEKPVLVPLMYLTIALSPLVWILNWLSYFNGSAHWSAVQSSFGGTESWEEIDFAAKFQPKASPAVLARGMLAMMRYHAADILPRIDVPTLVVAGDEDSTTKPEASQMMFSAIPGARLGTLSPAKHLGLIEQHDDYERSIRAFISAVTAAAQV